MTSKNTDNDPMQVYVMGGFITGIIAAILIYAYAIFQYGLVGLSFGWFPAFIGGIIAGIAWPIIAAILLIIFLPYILVGHAW